MTLGLAVTCESGETWEYLLNGELMDVFWKYIKHG